MGGRLDATNSVENPLATIITRLSYDHREYLGDTIDKIAREKAGIMRPRVPCFSASQPEALALQTLRTAAMTIDAPLAVGGFEWKIEKHADGFYFSDKTRRYDLPPPGLLGLHQYQNAGLAIAALSVLPQAVPQAAIAQGLRSVEWQGRLQRLDRGPLIALAPTGAEIWIDGGHNDSAGAALAAQIASWRVDDGANPKPLHVILGMLTTKHPAEFLAPFAQNIAQLSTVAIAEEPLSFSAAALADEVGKLGITNVKAAESLSAALSNKTATSPRILICGSLYLVGMVLTLSEDRIKVPS
jgi:dihydrofolate synthase/folylpolyglutamate synthase